MLKYTAMLVAGICCATSAQASITFNLNNVQLTTTAGGSTSAGALTGSFTTNDARTAIETFNIVASSFGAYTGFTYNPATASVTASVLPTQFFQLDSPGSIYELRLFFQNGLSATGGTFSTTASYEFEPANGSRFLSGSVVAAAPTGAVPEPATWAMMLLGFGLIGFGMRYSVRRSNAKFDAKIKRITAGLEA